MVGEAQNVGLMGSLALTPDAEKRAPFASDAGTVGYICRERSFANNLIMRHVGDRLVLAPPLIVTPDDIKEIGKRARKALDEAMQIVKDDGLWVAG
jgi:putrescine aminotransferase